jgi:hypothetical protein
MPFYTIYTDIEGQISTGLLIEISLLQNWTVFDQRHDILMLQLHLTTHQEIHNSRKRKHTKGGVIHWYRFVRWKLQFTENQQSK